MSGLATPEVGWFAWKDQLAVAGFCRFDTTSSGFMNTTHYSLLHQVILEINHPWECDFIDKLNRSNLALHQLDLQSLFQQLCTSKVVVIIMTAFGIGDHMKTLGCLGATCLRRPLNLMWFDMWLQPLPLIPPSSRFPRPPFIVCHQAAFWNGCMGLGKGLFSKRLGEHTSIHT